MKRWQLKIKRLGACDEAVEWIQEYETPQEAWVACECGNWMMWLLGRLSGPPESNSRKKLVLTACQCARLALPYVKKGEERPLRAIETAEKWARGEDGIIIEDVRKAAAAAYAAYAADAAYAAYAAAYAAYAADVAAYAAYAADAAARKQVLKQCADIVRQNYPEAPQIPICD